MLTGGQFTTWAGHHKGNTTMFIVYLAIGGVVGLGLAWFILFIIETIWEILRDAINLLFDI